MKKNIVITTTFVFCFVLFLSAMLRKDVAIEKYLNYAHQPQFDCVGEVLTDNNTLGGSCVLIGGKYVLTCAHLHAVLEKQKFKCKFGNEEYLVKDVIVNPNYIHGTYKGTDLAVLELEHDVTNIKPAELNSSFNERGKKGSIIGYGTVYFAGYTRTSAFNGEKIGGENMLDSIGGNLDTATRQYSWVMADFDNPADKKCCNVTGSGKALPLEYGVSGGDSGGGLFIKTKGHWKLAGITTGITHMKNPQGFGEISQWTRVSVFKDWINKAVRTLSMN